MWRAAAARPRPSPAPRRPDPPQPLPPADQQCRGRAAGCPHLHARPGRRCGTAAPEQAADGQGQAQGSAPRLAGRAVAVQSMSMVCAWRPVCSHRACKNAGLSGPARSSSSRTDTHFGSASMKITAWAVNPITPASRRDGAGTIVTPPSAGGNRPTATSSSTAASDPYPRWSSMRPYSARSAGQPGLALRSAGNAGPGRGTRAGRSRGSAPARAPGGRPQASAASSPVGRAWRDGIGDHSVCPVIEPNQFWLAEPGR